MNLLNKTVLIFIFIIGLIILLAAFPSPFMIGLTVSVVSLLVIMQAIVVLKDQA